MTICNSYILPRVEDTVGGTVGKLYSSEWNVKKTIWKIPDEILKVCINDWLLIILLKTLINVRLTILGLGLPCDEGGEACPKK